GPILAALGPEERDSQANAIALRLGGVALIVLLIACANVANLLIVRGVARGREFAIRAALGIDRRGIARLLLLESVLLAMIAGVAAVALGMWSGAALQELLFWNVNWAPERFDWRVAAFTLATALCTGLAAGLAPVIQARRADVSQMLKTGSHAGGRPRRRLRTALVIAQSTLSVVLLVGAALFVRSLHAVRSIDLGFDVQRLVFVSPEVDNPDPIISPDRAKHDPNEEGARIAAGLPLLASRLATIPGVEKVALTSITPMYALSITSVFYADGDSLPRGADGLPTVMGVSPEYFATTGLQLRQGRLLERGDVSASARVALVNETMAHSSWPHENAIGQCLRLGQATAPCITIVGIVEDAKRIQLLESPARILYIPAPQRGDYAATTIVVRVPPSRAPAVDALVRREMPAVIPGMKANVIRMAEVLAPQYRPWQLGALLFSIFGLLALLIAAVGIFSAVSHDVGQRRRELGVRVALGASVGDVVRLVLGGGLRVVALGVVAGVLVAVATSKLIASVLYGVAPRDPIVLGGVAVVLLAVAALASALPAWRASRADPMEALRVD
ncbi:MAG TPA: FtsX-like permease family protein, partial [Vicinamibacterales bacterium]|nr:FtsX-like permease family protein [Vicinamibacterales bacterium]